MIEYGKLKKLNEAPAAGQYLIYTRKAVLFAAYTSMAEVDAILQKHSENGILEIHLFDDKKEYRAVASSSKRYPEGVIEYVSEIADTDEAEIYVDHTLLDPDAATSGQKILNVLNHISYGENGMISIDDYRLVMGGVK